MAAAVPSPENLLEVMGSPLSPFANFIRALMVLVPLTKAALAEQLLMNSTYLIMPPLNGQIGAEILDGRAC